MHLCKMKLNRNGKPLMTAFCIVLLNGNISTSSQGRIDDVQVVDSNTTSTIKKQRLSDRDHNPLGYLNEPISVSNLRQYIRIQTAHPAPEMGYRQAIMWLQRLSKDIGLGFKLLEFNPPNLFAVIITWEGSDTTLKSIMFNSHMDVVATEPELWLYPPFEAHKDDKGNICGRGTSDMKSATVATLEAIRKLKKSGFRPRRTVHVTVLPDEEKGGLRGMKPFVESAYFKELNVGIDIDEGGGNFNSETMRIGYGAKSPWEFRVTAFGEESHSSGMTEVTAGQRLTLVVNKLMDFRTKQLRRLVDDKLRTDQITSLNLVGLGGGIAQNVIPARMWASFDVRIKTSDYNFTDIQTLLDETVEEATALSPTDHPVSIEFSLKSYETAETVADGSNVWFSVVQNACMEMNVSCVPTFIPAVSDVRWIRAAGIPAFGIGPFFNTSSKAHAINEFINENVFLKGIDGYQVLIRHLSTVPYH